ncbi:hypothetical protein ES703_52332 [subsurface metagenome]
MAIIALPLLNDGGSQRAPERKVLGAAPRTRSFQAACRARRLLDSPEQRGIIITNGDDGCNRFIAS